jgi:hypothetical protein
MKFRIPLLFALILAGLTGALVAQKAAPPNSATAAGLKLAKTLPDSDVVVIVDVKRLLSTVMPQVLSGNAYMLTEISGHIGAIKTLTGIDIQQFERVAVGATIKTVSEKDFDVSPVVLAQGRYSTAALLAGVKLASQGEYREEKIAGKTVYIFTPKLDQLSVRTERKASGIGRMIQAAIKGITSHEIGVGAVDSTTVIFGPVGRVKAALEPGARVGVPVIGLTGLQHGGTASFGTRLPGGLSALFGFDNDELGKSINTVKFLSGWMDIGSGSTILRAHAKTTEAQEADELLLTLQDLQSIGKALIGRSKGADKQVYARMIDNARFTRAANELTLDLTVPQTDIDILIGSAK